MTKKQPPKMIKSKKMDYRKLARQICAEESLSDAGTEILIACIEVESKFDPHAIHLNIKSTSAGDIVSSIDFGIVQVNDYYHIGQEKDFVSPEFVLNHPADCIRWMAKLFRAGQANLWSSFNSGAYKKYLPKVEDNQKKNE